MEGRGCRVVFKGGKHHGEEKTGTAWGGAVTGTKGALEELEVTKEPWKCIIHSDSQAAINAVRRQGRGAKGTRKNSRRS